MTMPKDQVQTGHELAMRLRAAYSFFRRRSSAELASLGMSSDQFVLLTVLAHEGAATQQELVRRCHSDTATLGTMLALLESKGFVQRSANLEDGRVRVASLTPAGEKLQKQLWKQSNGLRSELSTLFDAQEMTLLLGFMDRLIEANRPQSARSQRNATPQKKQFSRKGIKKS